VRAAASAGLLAAALAATCGAFAQADADPAAAEQQYRLAQRLGAEGSPQAAAAFEKVVTLSPRGPLADDALVDLARLAGAPDWPEDLGGLDVSRAAVARAPLEKVVSAYADGDRILEARYRLALLRWAPLPGREPVRAREELIALAASPSRDRWPIASRYALGVLDEQSGAWDRAAGGFERPDSDVASRAAAGLARTLLAAGRFGDAAAWYQEAIESGAPATTRASAQRELALREVLRERLPARRWAAVAAPLAVTATTKGAGLMTAAGDGRVVVFDRKNEVLCAFDAKGAAGTPVPLAEVTALASDPFGRVFAATKETLVRWDAAGLTNVLTLGSFSAPAAIAVDASGTVWIADRKGDRIARWAAGMPAPAIVRESKGAGVSALVVAGGRLIAAEEKTGRLVAFSASGAATTFATSTFRRPIALSVDAALRIAVLDDKEETVTRLSPSGDPIDTLALGPAGVSHAVALAATPSGAVLILDGGSGAVAVAP